MSVLIALIGIVNTMTLSIIERRREIGLLRAVGMLPNEARRMIRAESIVISLFGTLVGLIAGIFLGYCLTRPIELPGASFQFEWLRLGLVAIAGLLIGLVASLVPARRVSKMDVLDALADRVALHATWRRTSVPPTCRRRVVRGVAPRRWTLSVWRSR